MQVAMDDLDAEEIEDVEELGEQDNGGVEDAGAENIGAEKQSIFDNEDHVEGQVDTKEQEDSQGIEKAKVFEDVGGQQDGGALDTELANTLCSLKSFLIDEVPKKRKLPIRSSCKSKTKSNGPPIIISSPTKEEMNDMLQFIFQISYGHIDIQQIGKGRVLTTRASTAHSRLQSACPIEFISTRSKIQVDIDEALVRRILIDEASTRTLNLFALWMENTLPPHVLSKVQFVDSLWYSLRADLVQNFLNRFWEGVETQDVVFCFFPIICSALGTLAQFVEDSSLKNILYNPAKELQFKVVELNSTDCGFYVMAFMRYLIVCRRIAKFDGQELAHKVMVQA